MLYTRYSIVERALDLSAAECAPEQRYLLYTRYPIIARRAWPTGCTFRPSASLGLSAAECVARAKVSCIQRYLTHKYLCLSSIKNDIFDYCIYICIQDALTSRAWHSGVRLAECKREQRYLPYTNIICLSPR